MGWSSLSQDISRPLKGEFGTHRWVGGDVTGSNCYGYTGMDTDFDAAIELIASGKVDATKLVTHRFPLMEVPEAFRISADSVPVQSKCISASDVRGTRKSH